MKANVVFGKDGPRWLNMVHDPGLVLVILFLDSSKTEVMVLRDCGSNNETFLTRLQPRWYNQDW